VAQVQRRDQPFDGASLASGVHALEQRANRRAEALVAQLPAEVEPQLREPVLGRLEPFLVLGLAELEAEVELVEAADAGEATATGSMARRCLRFFTRSAAK
jgi:broad specificity phosphatase PhoE